MTFQRREFIPEEIAQEAKVKTESQRKKFLEWLKQFKGQPYLFDVNTYLNCFNIWERINHDDNDFFEVIAGKEGMGKSVFGMKKAAVVDPTFDKSRIFYDRKSLFNWIKANFNSKPELSKTKGKAVLLDEGNMFLFSREAMSMDNVDVVKLFTLIRQCNLYIIICIPSFKTVDTYIRTHRADRLTHIRQKANNWRLFSSYNKEGIDVINDAIKKGVAFDKILVPAQYLYHGGSNDLMPKMAGLDQGDYKEVKADAFLDYVNEKSKEADEKDVKPYVSVKEAAEYLGISREAIYDRIKDGTIIGRIVGRTHLVNRDWLYGNLPKENNSSPRDTSILPHSMENGVKKDELEH